ncbi:PepSY-associated TM helix domain-containing protein [Desmospora activa]|uniref:Putative iron-regulated membrane protein n=1 Tax=Desmospora activa DSM 45169 TaxID=1121389 RepID=A0A2T4ZA48_9BACL|nr:PepSY domain-containing protein [Desmospora activa]PTM58757.1 putative iron-regulated membrane protein [Desmospora activa DSM 45169]
MNTIKPQSKDTPTQGRSQALFRAIWRWHFYAGMIFSPFLVILAVTGGVYLFKPQIEAMMYKDWYQVEAEGKALNPSAQIDQVRQAYPDADITRYRPPEEESRSSEVGITDDGQSLTVFVNPYNGTILGELNNDKRLMDRLEEIHGELMAGTWGDRLVELAACWALILLITGIYLWWPRERRGVFGTILPRLKAGKRTFWRDLHAVPAFWLSLGIAFLILTGLPWSGFWGEQVQKMGVEAGIGYPSAVWFGEKPESTVPAKDIADVPWAAEQRPVPQSEDTSAAPLSIDEVVAIAADLQVHPGYDIFFPADAKGVYTLSVFPAKSTDEATLHVDQYSGKVLSDYRFDDYGPMAKIIATGITLHKGTHFGLPNQLAGLIVCIGIVAIAVTGIIMWWKRKPSNQLGAPTLPRDFKLVKGVGILVIVLGLLFPLVGLSLILVLLLDWLVIRHIPSLKKWLG